jgi:sporulation protein YlmC with PRC-barrel domain
MTDNPHAANLASRPAGRVYDLQLHLLDRQVVDPTGRMVAKVDDIELTPSVDEPGTLYVSAILTGPLALGPRLGGRLGWWVAAIARRLSPAPDPEPERIDISLVQDVGSAVTVSVRHDQLQVAPLERWLGTHLIARIPGSRHDSDDSSGEGDES